VHGSIQLNGNSIGIRKRLACTRVSYVNSARSTEGETYRDQAPAIRLRRSRRAVHAKAQGWATTVAALSPLCDGSGGDPVRRRGAAGRRAGRLDAGRRPTLRWRRHSTPLRERRFPTATASVGVIASGAVGSQRANPDKIQVIHSRNPQGQTRLTHDRGGQARAGAKGGRAHASSIIKKASENP
jgi:hypothetical protein